MDDIDYAREGAEIARSLEELRERYGDTPERRERRRANRQLREQAKAAGIGWPALQWRLSAGWPLDRALQTPVRARAPRGQSLAELARAAGMPMPRLRQRVARGWTLADALAKPPVKHSTGQTPDPDSLRQKAKAAGLGYTTLLARLKAGWPLETALRQPARELRRRNVAAKARRAGLGRTTVSERLRRGWSLAAALDTPRGQKPAGKTPQPTPERRRRGQTRGGQPGKPSRQDDD